jgi:pyruvate-formate lyase
MEDQNGAIMHFGRSANSLDIYFGRHFAEGILHEEQAQELIDNLVMNTASHASSAPQTTSRSTPTRLGAPRASAP